MCKHAVIYSSVDTICVLNSLTHPLWIFWCCEASSVSDLYLLFSKQSKCFNIKYIALEEQILKLTYLSYISEKNTRKSNRQITRNNQRKNILRNQIQIYLRESLSSCCRSCLSLPSL